MSETGTFNQGEEENESVSSVSLNSEPDTTEPTSEAVNQPQSEDDTQEPQDVAENPSSSSDIDEHKPEEEEINPRSESEVEQEQQENVEIVEDHTSPVEQEELQKDEAESETTDRPGFDTQEESAVAADRESKSEEGDDNLDLDIKRGDQLEEPVQAGYDVETPGEQFQEDSHVEEEFGETEHDAGDTIHSPVPDTTKLGEPAENAEANRDTATMVSAVVSATQLQSPVRMQGSAPTTVDNIRSNLHIVQSCLEEALKGKELKNYPKQQKTIENSATRIRETSESPSPVIDSILIFEALRAGCRTHSPRIQANFLDCLSKLFSFRALDEAILVNPPDSMASNDQNINDVNNAGITPPPKQKLIDAAVDTIADCFQGESTDEKVELQIIRALSSCILVEDTVSLCQGACLLKAIRTIYNIFVFSLNPSNQGIAQATLTQIINSVYEKVEVRDFSRPISRPNTPIVPQSSGQSGKFEANPGNNSTDGPMTLENFDATDDEADETQSETTEISKAKREPSSQDLAIKDAFLVFRAMAKICAKPLDSELDMRSHAVRSKLLSLHIIYSIIKDHVDLFLSPNIYISERDHLTFMDAVRQYLCLSLSRNAASPIAPIFEITLEIMWLIICNLRAHLVREIPVFLLEVYFPIAELKTSTPQQKRYFLNVLQRMCNDPRAMIEFYLNYDCNPGMPNVVETMVDYLTRVALTRVDISPTQMTYYKEQATKPVSTFNFNQLPLLTTSNLAATSDASQQAAYYPVEFALKMVALDSLVSVLRSLSSWAHKALNPPKAISGNESALSDNKSSSSVSLNTMERRGLGTITPSTSMINGDDSRSLLSQGQEGGDPVQFETLKQRKTLLSDCVGIFNRKPKRAIPILIQRGFLKDDSPESIAKWLLETDGLDLAVVGDFLGEGDEANIAVMHAFVDFFDFTGMSIVDALRAFLQKFRLPGEGQKIDRFMLKFAERYVDLNPGVFSRADTAYILSYSLIMLNTDLHSTRIKNKMTLEEFLENNRGIDNGEDLPKEFMINLFNEIANDEIKLQSEQDKALLAGNEQVLHTQPPSAFNFFTSRDLAREAYIQVSKKISNKTELAFKNMGKSKDGDIYYAASHVVHVKSFFETLWMSFLAGLTPPFREYDDEETANKCLEGLKISIKISAIFSIDDARKSFIGALVQFCNLQNLSEIRVKNVNAMIELLEVALSEGDHLKDSWKDILLVISQMERLQLISRGIDRASIPDVAQARIANPRASHESSRSGQSSSFLDMWNKRATPIELAQEKHQNQRLAPDMVKFISSSKLVLLMDNIFTKSSELSGTAIVDFIKALTDVSLEEIESSQHTTTPRMFSLQRMIDVCYYNMDRIRLEWTPLWAVMGRTFNRITTNTNLAVVFFALDSLRQLSMRFLDIDELIGFEFQYEFLKPFEYTIRNTNSMEVQEMILECFNNFILTKSEKIKSGWKPILESLQYVAASPNEALVSKTQLLVSKEITAKNFDSVFSHENGFFELVTIYKEISENKKFQKPALQALESLKKITVRIGEICFDKTPEKQEYYKGLLRGKDIFQDVWFPVLYCFNDTIMVADDLEVRSRALNYMFDALVAYGENFSEDFWVKICTKLLFPIFDVLSKHWEVNQFNSHDDLSVWLSTTLIQALRNLVALFTHYFVSLNSMLDGFFDLLVSCICQENDTIARIGRSCLQQLILQNVKKFNDKHWKHVGEVFEKLFALTTANELFDYDPMHRGRVASVGVHQDSSMSNNSEAVNEAVERAEAEETSEDVGNDSMTTESSSVVAKTDKPTGLKNLSNDEIRRRINIKNSIVVKCVLQLLMIELLSELFENEEFANRIPFEEAIKMTKLLERSYEFSRDFNADYGLRTRLVEARVVDKIPNLLKQETSAAAVFIDIMFKLYFNSDEETVGQEQAQALLARLVKICTGVVKAYVLLDDRTMERSVNSWRPVIVEILQGYYEFDTDDFKIFCPEMYALVIQILDKNVTADLRYAIKLFLGRVGEVYLFSEGEEGNITEGTLN